MANIMDIADHILEKSGYVSTMKLHKLAFYSHAYHLVMHDEPLVDDRFEAWANGPVVKTLFDVHRNMFVIDQIEFRDRLVSCGIELSSSPLNVNQRDSIDAVLASLGKLTGEELSNLIRIESPWLDAREGFADRDKSSEPIPNHKIREFYCSNENHIVFDGLRTSK